MMIKFELQNNISLKEKNTLRLDIFTKYHAEINSIADVIELVCSGVVDKYATFILGGGSNVIFSKNYQGIVLKINIMGVQVVYEDAASVHVKIGAGENWSSFVEYAVASGWGGLKTSHWYQGQPVLHLSRILPVMDTTSMRHYCLLQL